MLLLHKLGFHLPCDVGKLFPRIPHFWSADVLLSVAGKLGPLPAKEKLKFDPCEVIHATVMETCSNGNEGGNVQEDKATPNQDLAYKMTSLGVGVGLGTGFVSGHSTYGFGPATHSVNWINLVHKSNQFTERHR